jgi:dsDNA-binding SOS-regulon protein
VPFFVLGRYLSMSRKDAARYRAEAEKCREAAALATDSAARLHWEQAERCWLTMAKQAEVVVDLLRGRNQPTRLQKGQWQ